MREPTRKTRDPDRSNQGDVPRRACGFHWDRVASDLQDETLLGVYWLIGVAAVCVSEFTIDSK